MTHVEYNEFVKVNVAVTAWFEFKSYLAFHEALLFKKSAQTEL